METPFAFFAISLVLTPALRAELQIPMPHAFTPCPPNRGKAKLRPFGVGEANGFAICGADKVWHWAVGKIIGDQQIEIWSDEVTSPVAIRYAWADNPACNLFSDDGLPVTPFRSDELLKHEH